MTETALDRRTRVRATACCRVDLAGGTLDIWPLGVLHPGARTINVAIDLEATVELRSRPPGYEGYELFLGRERYPFDALPAMTASSEGGLVGVLAEHFELPPATIRVDSASPRGAGLGGSSAVAVALIAACERALELAESAPEARSALARDLESRLMGLPTGRQDHFPALLGGVLEILHQPGGERVEPLNVDLESLGDSLLVAYSGQSHFSAGSNWQVVRRRLDGDRTSVTLFAEIAGVAERMAASLRGGDLESVGKLMSEEWGSRRRLAPEVSTPKLEAMLAAALGAGAWGGKACGAGGGGCVAVLVPADRRKEVAVALRGAGGEILPAAPSARGVRVEDPGVDLE